MKILKSLNTRNFSGYLQFLDEIVEFWPECIIVASPLGILLQRKTKIFMKLNSTSTTFVPLVHVVFKVIVGSSASKHIINEHVFSL